MRKLAAVAVPFALVVGALAFTAAPANAIQSCTTNTMLLAAAQAAENEDDNWVASEDLFIDDDNYEAANYAYIQVGIAFKGRSAVCRGMCMTSMGAGPHPARRAGFWCRTVPVEP